MNSAFRSLQQVSALRVNRIDDSRQIQREDIAEEFPLSISIKNVGSLGMTLCTPKDLNELIIGYLFCLGLIDSHNEIINLNWISEKHCEVELSSPVSLPEFSSINISHSACGICKFPHLGNAWNEQTHWSGLPISTQQFFQWSHQLSLHQPEFSSSGGLHASALFTQDNDLPLIVKEDIGRHNSLDKLVGALLQSPIKQNFAEKILLLSGRAGYELIQKAIRARIAIVASIGAPSSLALELARQSGITLIGFLRNSHFNIYSHSHRIKDSSHEIETT